MFHTCNTGVYPTHVSYMWNYMCNTGVYVLHMYYTCRITCVIQVYILHMYYMCRILYDTCICHACNTPKTSHMYYRCSTIGHVYQHTPYMIVTGSVYAFLHSLVNFLGHKHS